MDATQIRASAIGLVEAVQLDASKAKSSLRSLANLLLKGPSRNARARTEILRELLPTILDFKINPSPQVRIGLVAFIHMMLQSRPLYFADVGDTLNYLAKDTFVGGSVRKKVVVVFNDVYPKVLRSMCRAHRRDINVASATLATSFGSGEAVWNSLEACRKTILEMLGSSSDENGASKSTTSATPSQSPGDVAVRTAYFSAVIFEAGAAAASSVSSSISSKNLSVVSLDDLCAAFDACRKSDSKWTPPSRRELRDIAARAVKTLVSALTSTTPSATKVRVESINALARIATERPQLSRAAVLPLVEYRHVVSMLETDREIVLTALKKKLGRVVATARHASIAFRDQIRDALTALDARDVFDRCVAEFERSRSKEAATTDSSSVQFVRARSDDADDAASAKRRKIESAAALPRPDPAGVPLPLPSETLRLSMERTLHELSTTEIIDCVMRHRMRLGGRPPRRSSNADDNRASTQARMSVLFDAVQKLRRQNATTAVAAKDTSASGIDPKAKSMLRAMGWSAGQGLGARSQGITDAIEQKTMAKGRGLGYGDDRERAKRSVASQKMRFESPFERPTSEMCKVATARLLNPRFVVPYKTSNSEGNSASKEGKETMDDDGDDLNGPVCAEQRLWESLVVAVSRGVGNEANDKEEKVDRKDIASRTYDFLISSLSSPDASSKVSENASEVAQTSLRAFEMAAALLSDRDAAAGQRRDDAIRSVLSHLFESATDGTTAHRARRFVRSLAVVDASTLECIKEYCAHDTRAVREMGLMLVRDLALTRPRLSKICIEFVLGLTQSHDRPDTQLDAVRLVSEQIFAVEPDDCVPASMRLTVASFARESLKKVLVSEKVDAAAKEEDDEKESANVARALPLYAHLCVHAPDMVKTLAGFVRHSDCEENVRASLFAVLRESHFFANLVRSPLTASGVVALLDDDDDSALRLLAVETLCEASGRLRLNKDPAWSETVMDMYKSTKRVDVLAAFAPLLSPDQLAEHLPTLLLRIGEKQDTKVRNLIVQIVKGPGSARPVDVLCTLHRFEGSNDVEDPAQKAKLVSIARRALQLCFKSKMLRELMPFDVVGNALRRIVDDTTRTLPKLLLRTVILSIKYHARIRSRIVDVLRRLVRRKIWEIPPLWKGFKIAIDRVIAQGHRDAILAYLAMPLAVLHDVVRTSEKGEALKADLRAFVLEKREKNPGQIVADDDVIQWLGCTILGKAELLNPGGSTKDRIAREIVLDAEARGDLKSGGTIVEGTSGSTGISLALMALSHGYNCEIVMPDDVSKGKSDLLEAFGANVRRVKAASIVNEKNYVSAAKTLAASISGGYFCDQFENPSNFKAHYRTTGPEIWTQTAGAVDAFVMGAGTGGTIAGVAAYLKERKPGIRVVLVDPPGSALANRVNYGVLYTEEQSERTVKRHRYDTIIEGVGLSRLTANLRRGLDMGVIDSAEHCSDQDAVSMSRYLLREEGLYLGSSSALNCVGAVKVARKLGPGHTIVTLLCDGGHRHRSRFWSDAYIREMGLDPYARPSFDDQRGSSRV
eukprot:g208.t1